MSFPYFARLLVLGLASFFLIHFTLALTLIAMRHSLVRMASCFPARQATRFLLILRLFPAVFTTLLVAGLCVPSYLWLEPDAETEAVGFWCLAAALLGAAIWTISISRGVQAVVRSIRQSHQFEKTGIVKSLPGSRAVVIEERRAIFAMCGVVHPQLFISRDVVDALSDEQVSSAVRHELAHRASRDNLKRLLLLLAPDMLPFVRGMRAFDRAWCKFTEWAADDQAVNGNPDRSVSLATALVQVARLGIRPQTLPLATSLLGADQDMYDRVNRLLEASGPQQNRGTPVITCAALAVLSVAAAWSMAQPATWSGVYRLLELMLR